MLGNAIQVALATFLMAWPASAHVGRQQAAHLEIGDFSEFFSSGVVDGQLFDTTGRAYDGRRSGRATYCGGGQNGYARGVLRVDVREGEDVWYGEALYLPPGFKRSVQGEVDLLRWDNFGLFGADGDYGGVVMFAADHRGHLLRGQYSGDANDVTGTFELPEGRWFWLEAHQRLSLGGAAVNEVFVDGARVARSTRPNAYGRPVDRVRYGVVAIQEGRQHRRVTLYFDRASVAGSQIGPLPPSSSSGVARAVRRSGDRRGTIRRSCVSR
jgi:hypothetical protein